MKHLSDRERNQDIAFDPTSVHLGSPLHVHLLHLERDLNYFRLCVGNVMILQEMIGAIQKEIFTCAACNIVIPGGDSNMCSAHSGAISMWEQEWARSIKMCMAAVEGRSGDDLRDYVKSVSIKGQKAQDALNAVGQNVEPAIKKITISNSKRKNKNNV